MAAMNMRDADPERAKDGVVYVSAAARLRTLPSTFSLEQLCTLQNIPKVVGLKYASRWAQAGHLRTAGPRVGYYANLVRSPELAEVDDWLAAALLHTYPTAVVLGSSVLNAAGWITQHPHEVQVAVLAPANRSRIDGYNVVPRARRWFERMHDWVVRPRAASTAHGTRAAGPVFPVLPALAPAAALADIYAGDTAWHPDPDDLEIPEGELAAIAAAFDALRSPMPEWLAERCAESGPEASDDSDPSDSSQQLRAQMRSDRSG